MKHIKKHFAEEAEDFNQIILKLIPYYDQMLEALVLSIPYNRQHKISVIDLGCGTGTVSLLVKKLFPRAQITCLDLTENMIARAKIKLKEYPDIDYMVRDLNRFNFDKDYDVVISSLALHHLVTDNDKLNFYKKIYNSLNKGGVFFNADVVLASNNYLQQQYLKKWVAYMKRSISVEEIENKWLVKYNQEDRPARVMDQIDWFKQIGFTDVDIIWKYYNFAVYGAYKS